MKMHGRYNMPVTTHLCASTNNTSNHSSIIANEIQNSLCKNMTFIKYKLMAGNSHWLLQLTPT